MSTSAAITHTRAAKSVLWSVVENGGLALISFASLVIYSRLLSPSDFGVFSAMLALVELLGVLVSMTFHDVLVQRREVTELHFDTAFTSTLGLSLILAAACCAISPLFATWLGRPETWPMLCALSACFPASALSATIVPRQRRELQFKTLALRSLVGRVAGAAGGVGLVALGAGIWGLVAQQVLIVLVGSVILWIKSERHPRIRFGKVEFAQLVRFGAGSVSVVFLTFAVKRLFVILAGIYLGAQAAGYLNLSLRAVDVFWAIAATAVSQVTLPIMAGLQADPLRMKRVYRQATTFACLALYLCFGTLAMSAPEVVELLFGAQWMSIDPYVSALAVLIVVQAPRLLMSPVLTALGRPRDPLIALAAELLVVVAGTLLTHIPSVTWAVGIWIAREVIGLPIMAWLLRRATGFGIAYQLGGVAVPLAAALAMGAAAYVVRPYLSVELGAVSRLAIMVAVCVSVFLCAAIAFDRGLPKRAFGLASAALQRGAT
jgi:PST family polysaccharide transporter